MYQHTAGLKYRLALSHSHPAVAGYSSFFFSFDRSQPQPVSFFVCLTQAIWGGQGGGPKTPVEPKANRPAAVVAGTVRSSQRGRLKCDSESNHANSHWHLELDGGAANSFRVSAVGQTGKCASHLLAAVGDPWIAAVWGTSLDLFPLKGVSSDL